MDIVKEILVDAPASKVYAAFTDAREMAGWWCKDAQLGSVPGDVNKLRFNKDGQIVDMQFRIVELTPESHLVWSCVENTFAPWVDTAFCVDITPEGENARVRLTHSGWDADKFGREVIDNVSGGWDHFLQSLTTYCKTGVGAAI